jgi:NAD(P)-dependent dehydrogenase (short-subunit alcohol dehydrogenase family)
MVRSTLEEFGRIDVLVNNAGIMAPGRLWEIPVKRWDLVMRVNVRGTVRCCQEVIPHMIEQKDGVIIYISSIAADQVGAGNTSYSVTKQALRKLSEGLAREVREFGIRVFAISPEGLVITPGTMYHRLPEQTPSGPYVEAPEAMGKAVIAATRLVSCPDTTSTAGRCCETMASGTSPHHPARQPHARRVSLVLIANLL